MPPEVSGTISVVMKRRDVLIAGVAAGGVAVAQEHLPLLAPDTVAKAGAAWKPSTLSAAQNELVVVLSELIIPATDTPGAKAALVNRYVDLFLGEMPAENRDRFISGLRLVDQQAGGSFVKLDPARQVALLEKLDAGEESDEGTRFFRTLKGLVARIYYQTEIGWKELNKRGVPRTFACSHEGAHKG